MFYLQLENVLLQRDARGFMTKIIRRSFYENIVMIDAGKEEGYKVKKISSVEQCLDKKFTNLDSDFYIPTQQDREIQKQLVNLLCMEKYPKDFSINVLICLRCYVSHFILQACQEKFWRFNREKQHFKLRELLAIVLNDDGKPLPSVAVKERFIPYSFQILQEYLKEYMKRKEEGKPIMGLDKWVLMKTKQNDAIENFLLQRGVCTDSDWGILNTTSCTKLEKVFREFHIFSLSTIQHLSELEIQRAGVILQSFHEIYRGERQRNRQYGRCQPPTETQLQRMIDDLWATHKIEITPPELMNELKAIGSRLRDYRLSCHNSILKCKSLHELNPQTGEYAYANIPDPKTINDLEQIDYQQRESCKNELQSLLSNELIQCLDQAIDQGFCDVIKSLSRKCEHLAKYIKPAFQLLYCEGMSQTDTASRLHIQQCQVSRYIKPLATKLFQQVKQRANEELLQRILYKVKSLNVVDNPENLDYFDNLVNQLQVFLESKIFPKMEETIGNSRTRQMNSLYFQRLSIYLTQYKDILS